MAQNKAPKDEEAMRYRVDNLPVVGAGAFTPLASTNPIASSFGTVKRTAMLGLQPVHTPAPTRVFIPPNSADPFTQSSNVVPDYITPDCYVAYADNMGPAADAGIGMATRRLAPLPVPAVAWIPRANPAFHRTKIGGRRALMWPRAFQRFPGGR